MVVNNLWKTYRLYKIRKRYVAKYLSPSGANYWVMRILDENKTILVLPITIVPKRKPYTSL